MKFTNTHNIAVACGQDVSYVGDVATYIHGPSMLRVKHISHKVEVWNRKEACLVLVHMRLLETNDVYVLLACYDVNDTTFGCGQTLHVQLQDTQRPTDNLKVAVRYVRVFFRTWNG